MGFKNSAKAALCVALSLWLALGPGVASACTVPVFRYALERWPSDAYRIVVFHKGELSEADQAVVDWLKDVGTPEEGYERLLLRTVDVEGEMDEQMQSLWKEQTKREEQAEEKEQAEPKLPWMVVLYPPFARIPVPAWTGPLTADAAKQLVKSPAREKVAERILGGDSVVWLFLESGKKEKDAAALKLLKTQLDKLEDDLEIPPQAPAAPMPGAPPAPGAAEVYEDDPAAIGPELKVAFSILPVKRSDLKEQTFIEMLLHTEKGLTELDEPMAFAMYGRGRALWALVGEGINEQNIFETSAFMIGPCACQIKAQAPGTDMLTLTDWDGALMGEEMVEEELPPLLGVPDTVALAKAEEAEPKEAAETQPTAMSQAAEEMPGPQEAETAVSPLARNVAIALVAALAILGVATAVVVRRNRNSTQE